MKRIAPFAIAILVVAAALWSFTRPLPDSVGAQGVPSHGDKLPAVAVLSVRPGVTGPGVAQHPPPVSARSASAVSPNFSQYLARKEYASLYQRLLSDNSAESLYLRAQIYARCARQGGKSAQEVAQENADKRAKFLSSVSQAKADTPRRIEAFDRLYSDPCSGLDLGAFSPEVSARLMAAAASAGDVRAQATQLADRIEGKYHDSKGQTPYQLTDADLAQARQLMASGDPDVFSVLQGVLASTLETGSIRLNGEPFDPNAMHSALGLLACDAGGQCGADSPPLLAACAYRGQCLADNMTEYLYYYQNAPSESQQVDLYRQALLAMLNARDFSGLTYSPTDNNSGYRVTFGRGRRGG